MPLVSVIVPVYKAEDYLEKCISSITAQTFADLELILVDDGSPDKPVSLSEEEPAKESGESEKSDEKSEAKAEESESAE